MRRKTWLILMGTCKKTFENILSSECTHFNQHQISNQPFNFPLHQKTQSQIIISKTKNLVELMYLIVLYFSIV